ncbi:SusC/RagA family TonB-linked outer membrane protein [Mucilaginibacter boryungensis]
MQSLAQNTVSGRVTSAEDNTPLPGVTVKVKGTTTGVQTSVDGTYTIKASQGQVLVFSFVGTQPVEQTVTGSGPINVKLKADTKSLNEVIVTALGIKQNRRGLGYQAQQLNAADIAESNQTNPLNALKGKLAGVQITSDGGAAGSGTRIQIRGINSLSPSANNQPLFVIDGIPVSNNTDQFGGASGDGFQNSNRFSDINPDDIETMTVLKGPAASALYGLRAGNGAIVITTKSGKAGKTSFNYKTSFSFDDVTRTPPIQTTYGNGNLGANAITLNTWGPPIAPGTPVYNPYDLFFKTGHMLQNAFTTSGGTDKISYYTSFDNAHQKGVVPNSTYDKNSFRINTSLRASDKLKFDATANYINANSTNPRTGVSSGAIYYLMKHTNTVDPSDYLNADGTQKVYNASIDNPFYFAQNAYLKTNVNRIIGTLGFDFTPTNWLDINYKVGVDHYTDFRQAYIEKGLIISRLGSMDEQRLGYNEINSNFIAKATKQFNSKWSGSLLVGQAFTNIKSSSLSTNASQAIVDKFISINNYSVYAPTGSSSKRNIFGVFGEANLSYNRTLYLDVTGRNDWSSTLPESNRSFFYPSASLSYVFTETLGMQNNPIFNFGKLRVSYAAVGKDTDPYQIGLYYQTVQAFNGVSGIRQATTIGDSNLLPERNAGPEFGGEFHFLNDRITLDANYAITYSTNQIVPVPTSLASGFDTYVTNSGKIRNNSIELLLSATVFNNDKFKWTANANWSSTKGSVLTMPPGVSEIAFQPATPWVKEIIKTGGRPGDWYGWPYQRVSDPNSPYNGQLIIGSDGFPSVNQNLAVNYLVGNAFPDWVGGIGSTFSYKNFTLSFQFNFRKGGDVFDISRYQRYITGIGAETQFRNAAVVYKGVVNTGTAAAPVYAPNTQTVNITQSLFSNLYEYEVATENNGFQDASWIRLQNVGLSYSLPKSILSRTFIKSATLSVTGNNLWVSTPFIGFDPESSTYGAASNAVGYVGTGIPATRSIFMALNVNF